MASRNQGIGLIELAMYPLVLALTWRSILRRTLTDIKLIRDLFKAIYDLADVLWPSARDHG